jgi:hypothetical protein
MLKLRKENRNIKQNLLLSDETKIILYLLAEVAEI